ncbi:uncharacterized protein [Onthophagus taurus]|uniref:uncharacterized protein isoform X3 n=1 Tax=Onthophagus taurus TaxID=166361 RepID=UPI0039BE8A6D
MESSILVIIVISLVVSAICLILALCLIKSIHRNNVDGISTIHDLPVAFTTNQDDDVWNISSRVNQQNQDGTPPNWPTHDHRLSMDFVITPEYNIKDTRPPPPPYSELDLPSYEQATGCRPPRADLTPVHQQSDQNRPGPSS